MMSASHDEAHLEVPKAHESVDSRDNVAGGRQMSPAELAQMEAAGYHPDKFRRHTTTCDGLPSRIKEHSEHSKIRELPSMLWRPNS